MRTTGTPRSASYSGYTAFNFEVSQELDNEVALGFRAAFDAGSESLPQSVMDDLQNPKSLSNNQRYARATWGLTGPNCVSHTFGTLKEILRSISAEGSAYPDTLRDEARAVHERIERMDTFTFSPAAAKEVLTEDFERDKK
jgi:hypothetical protein